MSTSTEKTSTFLRRFRAVVAIALIVSGAWYVYANPDHTFKLGLDLAGGSHLIYEADTSSINPVEVPELMNVLRDVIERRVNIFGVSEPIVQVESSSFVTEEQTHRLVVELPGVTDVSEAVAEIGRTPLLEFKLLDQEKLLEQNTLDSVASLVGSTSTTSGAIIGDVKVNGETIDTSVEINPYIDTGLTGRYLEAATLEFAGSGSGQLANEPLVTVRFTAEGATLFADITRSNVGEQLGIFLDGELISAPRINEAITGGTATISGGFTAEEARELAQNLSFGALPLPIELVSTQTIGASLGAEVLQKGITAGIYGIVFVLLFMVLWYRIPGLIAGLALASYIVIMLTLFQYIPVTLTAAGLAGFIISLGMAVDANVLVFERMKEEWRSGTSSRLAAEIGFKRAWSAIRDGNITSLLSAIILFWFGTSMVKGFALVFGLGVVVSMFTAIVVTRTFLVALPDTPSNRKGLWTTLLGSGLSK